MLEAGRSFDLARELRRDLLLGAVFALALAFVLLFRKLGVRNRAGALATLMVGGAVAMPSPAYADSPILPGNEGDVGVYTDAITCEPGTLNAQNYNFVEGPKGTLTLTKPQGSLGRLETIVAWLARWQGRDTPRLDKVKVIVYTGRPGMVIGKGGRGML